MLHNITWGINKLCVYHFGVANNCRAFCLIFWNLHSLRLWSSSCDKNNAVTCCYKLIYSATSGQWQGCRKVIRAGDAERNSLYIMKPSDSNLPESSSESHGHCFLYINSGPSTYLTQQPANPFICLEQQCWMEGKKVMMSRWEIGESH